MPLSSQNKKEFFTDSHDVGHRIDVYLDSQCPELSRSQIKKMITQGQVTLNAQKVKASTILKGNEKIILAVPEPTPLNITPEEIPLDILYEDGDLLVLRKAAETVVHPGAGIHSGTLVNAILHHCQDLSGIGGKLRPGIVHRLDKGTSGVILIAKNDSTHRHLSSQFQSRSVEKTYHGFVWGRPRALTGVIDSSLGRDPKDRKKISSRSSVTRRAITEFAMVKAWGPVSFLELQPQTGRTHQIRVHLAESGIPLVGDPTYGKGLKKTQSLPENLQAMVETFRFQLLHASRLKILHPTLGKEMSFEAPLREEMEAFRIQLDRWSKNQP